MGKNITWHDFAVSRSDREVLLGQKGALLWFTGLSGSGKSTLANAVAKKLHQDGKLVYVLDGDNVRHGINNDLGFSEEDREENIRRITEVAKLFVDSGVIVLTAFISPFRTGRDNARELLGDDFIEVFVDCPLEICEQRDPKGLYKKARAGEIKNFTGIDQPYEAPLQPELKINTGEQTVEQSSLSITQYLSERYKASRKTPNVFIIGEPKSGTTTLAELLNQHPDIHVPDEKEPSYFSRDFVKASDEFHGTKTYFGFRNSDAYFSLYDEKIPFNVDASTNYAYSEVAADLIHEFNPEAKIIYIVRNPVKFVASLHAQYVKETTEDELDLYTALQKEDARKAGEGVPSRQRTPAYSYYLERIKFDEHYKKFIRHFPNMLVFTQESMATDTSGTLKKIEAYLGVHHHNYQIASYNTRRAVKYPRLNRLMRTPLLSKTAVVFLTPTMRKWIRAVVTRVLTTKQAPAGIDARAEALIKEAAKPHMDEFERLTGIKLM